MLCVRSLPNVSLKRSVQIEVKGVGRNCMSRTSFYFSSTILWEEDVEFDQLCSFGHLNNHRDTKQCTKMFFVAMGLGLTSPHQCIASILPQLAHPDE